MVKLSRPNLPFGHVNLISLMPTRTSRCQITVQRLRSDIRRTQCKHRPQASISSQTVKITFSLFPRPLANVFRISVQYWPMYSNNPDSTDPRSPTVYNILSKRKDRTMRTTNGIKMTCDFPDIHPAMKRNQALNNHDEFYSATPNSTRFSLIFVRS